MVISFLEEVCILCQRKKEEVCILSFFLFTEEGLNSKEIVILI
jgi:hypothetical protein